MPIVMNIVREEKYVIVTLIIIYMKCVEIEFTCTSPFLCKHPDKEHFCMLLQQKYYDKPLK